MSVGWLVHHNFLKVREITLIILLFLALVFIYNILISSLSTGCSKTNSTVPREYFCELVFLMFLCHNINLLLFSFMCLGISSTKLFPLYVNFFSKTTPPNIFSHHVRIACLGVPHLQRSFVLVNNLCICLGGWGGGAGRAICWAARCCGPASQDGHHPSRANG